MSSPRFIRSLLLLSVVLFCSANIAFAQGGRIGLYSDSLGMDCSVFDTQPGVIKVYVVHELAPEWQGASFSVPIPACALGWTFFGDQQILQGVKIGFSHTGISVTASTCQSTPVHFLTIIYFGEGLSENCCRLIVLPPEGMGDGCSRITDSPCMVDCADNLLPAGGGAAIINPGGACQCTTVATEETTWGRIKSLYSE